MYAMPAVRRLGMGAAVFVLAAIVLAQTVHGQQSTSYREVTVGAGDTVWSIAAENFPSADPREKVPDILRANNLEQPVVYPGEHLKIPAA